jgi:hypothetical protein
LDAMNLALVVTVENIKNVVVNTYNMKVYSGVVD